MSNPQRKIAVLLCNHNRREMTLRFLASLASQRGFVTWDPDVYLLDDASNDGTAEAIRMAYPFVKILQGTGSLFWAGGMRKIWKHARSCEEYDFFLLFNNDVVLSPDAFDRLFLAYESREKEGTIVVGSTVDPDTGELSYGGHRLYKNQRSKYMLIYPDDTCCMSCQLGHANVLLVDRETVNRIGILSDKFTHYLADFDYTLRALEQGIDVVLAPGFYGSCKDDHGTNWLPSGTPLNERIAYLKSPKGLAYREYLYYIKRHFPADYYSAYIKLWLKTLVPWLWDSFKKSEKPFHIGDR